MTHMTRMTHCDSSVPTVGHSFFEALLPLVIIRTFPSSFIVSCFSVQKSRKKGKKAKNLGQFLGGYETLGPLLGGYIPKYGLQHQRGHVSAYIFVHFWFLDPTDLSMYRVTWSEKVKETICFSPQERTRLNFSVRGREAV